MKLLWSLVLAALPLIVFTQGTCPNGKVFSSCGSSCPLTCDNFQNPPLFCTSQCVVGCFCPSGTVEQGEGCVAPSECGVAATTEPPPTCANGMIHQTCGTACPLTCEYPDPRPCIRVCVNGCFCPTGLLQYNGRCITREECPTSTTSPPLPTTEKPVPTVTATTEPPPTCANGMIHQTCGTGCPLTCEYPDPRPCISVCVNGCFCPTGLLQYNGRCVTREECPTSQTTAVATPTAVSTPPSTCTNGMIHSDCGTACPLTCEHPDPRPCFDICVRGCFCPTGQLQYEGRCVTRDQCPTSSSTTPTAVSTPPSTTCTNGMTYSDCGTACPLTCEHPDPRPCPAICAQGCFCPAGLLQYEGRCVTRQECPSAPTPTPPATPAPVNITCTNGRVFRECGPVCPPTCNSFNPCFSLRCFPGCFCPEGQYEHEGECVSSCPEATPTSVSTPPFTTCTNGMTYSDCGTACPLTCEHPDPRPCPEICAQGCFCPAGLLQYEGRCVTRQECPSAATPTPPATPAPVNITCTNGRVFRECGPVCPPTCNSFNPCFSLRCFPGCFCPEGQYEHEGQCVSSCPEATQPTATPPPPQTTELPISPCASMFCASGYRCEVDSDGQGRCVSDNPCTPLNCRPCAIDPQTGMGRCGQNPCSLIDCWEPSRCVYNNNTAIARCEGNSCYRLNCRPCGIDPITNAPKCGQDPCSLINCQWPQRCEYNNDTAIARCVTDPCSRCVWPQQCKISGPNRTCVDNPCDLVHCLSHERCEVDANGRARCLNYTCAVNNGGCRADQECEMAVSGCGPTDRYCNRYPRCKDALYVPCGSDAFLACDSEWTYCLQQNKTRRAQCVGSCLSRNGNCDDDSVCITTVREGRTSLQCMATDDIPSDCPAGMTMNQCGNLCQLTCEQHITGRPQICPLICGPAACACPAGLALFRDRCVDPKLCYVLINYPPAIKPLPVVDPNTVLLSLSSRMTDQQAFMAQREDLLDSIERTLAQQGHTVVATIHGIHVNDDMMQIVVELSGDDVTSDSYDVFADALRQNSQLLTINIEGISPVNVDYVQSQKEPEQQGLTEGAVIGIAVSGGVAGVAVIAALIAVIACCCVLSAKKNTQTEPTPPEYKNELFNNYSAPGNEKKQSPYIA